MLIRRPSPFCSVLAGLLGLGVLPAALAAPTVISIPIAPYGDASEGSVSATLPLTPNSYLCAAEGADGSFTTADDVVLLVNNLGGTPTVTALATPYLTNYSGRLVQLSATRALAISAGADGAWSTADDAILLLDRLGSDNAVTSIVVGGLAAVDGYSPVALSSKSAVVASEGADLTAATADDVLFLLQDLGGANTVTSLTAPSLDSSQSRVTALTPTSFIVASNGPDRVRTNADDQVYLFTGVGTTNTRTDLNVPDIARRAPRQAVRLSATRAILTTAGPDHLESTADDRLVLLDQLGTLNTITAIPVPNIHDYGAGRSVALSPTTVIVGTEGPDSTWPTADDQAAVVTGLGGANTVTMVTAGSIDEDAVSRAVRLSPTRVAFCVGGTMSPAFNNADDEVVVIDGVGTMNAVTHIPLPGVADGVTSQVVALSNSAFLVNHGGPNGVTGTGGDDVVALVTGTGSGYTIESVPAIGHFDTYSAPTNAAPLGRGRAVFVSGGPNNQNGTGDDDLMRILSGLPEVRGIEVTKLNVGYQTSRPNGPETFSASGRFGTDDPGLLFEADLTVSVGNFSQTIPASRLKRSRKGVYSYTDPKHRSGAITKLTIDPAKRKFSVSGKGVGTGLRANLAAYVPVAFGGFREHLSDAVTARAYAKGLRFP